MVSVYVIGKCTDVFREIFFGWGERLRGGDYVGVSFHGGIFHGGREFPWKDFLVLFKKKKNNEKINLKSFQLKVRMKLVMGGVCAMNDNMCRPHQ